MKEYAYIEGNDYSEGYANGYKKAVEDLTNKGGVLER